MPSNSGGNLKNAIYAVEIPLADQHPSLPFELLPANDDDPLNDPFDISRWEDDGGFIGKEDGYGE